jgi:N-acetylmuramic acid 6-phosphate etherase
MAIAGSTRMQATSVELIIVGGALETALLSLTEKQTLSPIEYGQIYTKLIQSIQSPNNLKELAKFTESEYRNFLSKGQVTYLANQASIDILTDTTERSPTFSIPSFRKVTDLSAPTPYCFLKDPQRSTPDAWNHILQRPIRGINWGADDYQKIGAPAAIIHNPPNLSKDSILEFQIGNEPDTSRIPENGNALLSWLIVDSDLKQAIPYYKKAPEWVKDFSSMNALIISSSDNEVILPEMKSIKLNLHIPKSPLRLWEHLACKLTLNTHSTATLTLADRVRGNWMIHVQATNKKLIDRASRLISSIGKISYEDACILLYETMEEIQAIPPSLPKPSPSWLSLEKLKR